MDRVQRRSVCVLLCRRKEVEQGCANGQDPGRRNECMCVLDSHANAPGTAWSIFRRPPDGDDSENCPDCHCALAPHSSRCLAFAKLSGARGSDGQDLHEVSAPTRVAFETHGPPHPDIVSWGLASWALQWLRSPASQALAKRSRRCMISGIRLRRLVSLQSCVAPRRLLSQSLHDGAQGSWGFVSFLVMLCSLRRKNGWRASLGARVAVRLRRRPLRRCRCR